MEAITLENLKKHISVSVLKKAEKLVVRDIDEEKANFFVAYVDQNDDSYDVAIEVSDKREIINSRCDCNGGGFCIHRMALANYLSKKRIKKESVSRKKKVSQSEELIAGLDPDALKKWVVQLLHKNKDLELLFVNEFSLAKTEYTTAEVKLLINNAIKSVIKNKKNVEISELKKIIDLLDITLKPVIQYCNNNLSEKESVEIWMLIFDELKDFDNRIYSNSVRITRYLEQILNEVLVEISSIRDFTDWKAVIDMNVNFVFFDAIRSLKIVAFEYIVSIYKSTENAERKKYFAEKFKEFFLLVYNNKLRLNGAISNFLLEVFVENNLFEEVFLYFNPIRYENDFNLSLIDNLIVIDQIAVAEKFAQEQVTNNSYVEYSVAYWMRLKAIYILTEDIEKLVPILLNTINIDFDFDDYLMIQETISAEEFKKFRSNLLGRAKRNFDNSKPAVVFYFKVLFSEKSFIKMIDLISYQTGYYTVYDYIEELYLTDKLGLLGKLATIESKWYFYENDSLNLEYRDMIIDWILTRYDKIVLDTFLKNRSQYGNTIFYEEMVKKINA
ncbi:hypothetical protein [Flavobacterium sp. ZS1P14]|uniref:hypothetical protein n=1 Tax=Flavobacterium sp. ZS1P14 TaxID=3401729 RepID=UPI003AAE9604